MSRLQNDDYIVTSIEEQEYISKDFRKSLLIIVLGIISASIISLILYFL